MRNKSYKKTTAEREAEWLWKLYGFSKPSELILEDIAFVRGVIVSEGPLEKMEARLVRSGERGLIRVHKNILNIGQKRFAIAHELGHWELHRKDSQFFTCTNEDMVASYKMSSLEGEANFFAAGLLMPSELFIYKANKNDFSFDEICILAEYFNTSLTATAIRYVELSNDYYAVVCSESGKIKWWRGSSDFESRFWITARKKLTNDTVAMSLFNSKTKFEITEEVDINAWCDRVSYCESDTIIETSKYFERFNQVISLLKLP